MSKKSLPLGQLKKGVRARIISVSASSEDLVRNLLEMGLIEGSMVRVVHQAPLGGDPIAVEVRGALIALRRQEAAGITVELSDSGGAS
ncbi:MAG: ferrous iron transport protein A [Bdellovibrionales bacterium]|nr:ferrous iron transport protein A [Bdellovibrionales bacterium]